MSDNGLRQSNNLQWIIPALVLMIFLFSTLFSYNKTMKERAEEKALERVSKQAVSVAGYYGGQVDVLIDAAQTLANLLVGEEDIISAKNGRTIDETCRTLGLENVYIVARDQRSIDNDGNMYDENSEFSKRYSSLLSSEPMRFISVTKEGKPVVVISAPIRTEKEWSGDVIFVYNPHKMSELIESTTYTYYFVFSNGLVGEIFGEDAEFLKPGDDINSILEQKTFVSGSAYTFKKSVEANRSGTICIDDYGHKRYITYQPVGEYGACVLVSVMDNQIEKSAQYDNKPTNSLIIKISIAVAIFVALVITIYIVNKVGYARQNKELQDKAETDLLTDLYNKVSTQNKIQEYLDGEGKDKISMMCVLDVDNFKKINDTMGHAFGDEVLSSLGKRIRGQFRVTDIVGRIGGDEFVIFLKDLKEDAIIEREAKKIENFFKDFQVGSYTKYSPTASIGAAIYPRDAHDYESLYKAGDAALYKAKKRGKNQLAFYRDAEDEEAQNQNEQ